MIRQLVRSTIERIPALALVFRSIRDVMDQRHPSRNTPWGFTFAGHDAMARGNFEPDETELVRRLLSEVDVLVNIGANVGYYCCHALSVGKPVIAVEPNPRNLHYLLKNVESNGWANLVEVFPVAIGAGVDILQMWGGGTGASLIRGWAGTSESYAAQVPVLSLDRVLGDALDGKRALILADIEGAEYFMLQGATQTLINAPPPIWMLEIATTEHQPAGTAMNPYFSKTFDVFFSKGYRSFTADNVATEITPTIVERVATGAQRLTTHNFLFRL